MMTVPDIGARPRKNSGPPPGLRSNSRSYRSYRSYRSTAVREQFLKL